MCGNNPTHHDVYDKPCDELVFGQFCDIGCGGAGNSAGHVDGDQVSWDTHPIAVDEPFQRQHHDSSTPLSSVCDPGFPGPAAPFYGWENDDMTANFFASFPDFAACSPAGASAAPPSAAGPAQPATPFINMEEQPATVPMTSPATCKEVDEETLLKSLRDAGYGFSAISDAMREQLGIKITANALVKRYQKMPKTCENLLANALANIMPQIMEHMYAELPHMDNGSLSADEKETVDRMLQDLPQVLPNCVRSSLSRKRKSMQPPPLL